MTDAYSVRIFESELRVICDETMDYPDIETGGNLFGSLSHGGSPTVWLATRPDGTFRRDPASLELDHVVEYEVENAAWARYGIQFLGMWHSHHQIGLYEPSGGDRRRTANYAASAKRKFYVEILCNLPRQQAYSRNPPMAVTANAAVVGARENDGESLCEEDEGRDAHDESGQPRKKRRDRAREERRAARGTGRGSRHLRAAGPVHVAPFVYVDARRLEQADASFVMLPGISPVRQAIAATDLAQTFAEAFRPADSGSREAIRYELGVSRASRYRGGYAGSGGGYSSYGARAGETGPGTTGVTPGGASDVRPVATGQPVSAGTEQFTGTRQAPADRRALPEVRAQEIPDMARYVEEFVAPLVRSRPQFLSIVDPDGKDKIILRVSSRDGSGQLLLVMGWDGKAPAVLSCAVTHGDGSPTYPDPAEGRGVNACFYWGVGQL